MCKAGTEPTILEVIKEQAVRQAREKGTILVNSHISQNILNYFLASDRIRINQNTGCNVITLSYIQRISAQKPYLEVSGGSKEFTNKYLCQERDYEALSYLLYEHLDRRVRSIKTAAGGNCIISSHHMNKLVSTNSSNLLLSP